MSVRLDHKHFIESVRIVSNFTGCSMIEADKALRMTRGKKFDAIRHIEQKHRREKHGHECPN